MGIRIYSRREFLKKVGFTAAAVAAGKPIVLKGLSSPAPSPSGLRNKFSGPIYGVVFTDLNRNGRKDPDEPVRAGVAVSDGLDVVLTGPDGRYELDNKKGDSPFVFVVQPSDSGKTPMTFYRLPSRTDSETTEINFGLLPADSRANPTRTRFVQITDTHTTNLLRRDLQIKATAEILNLTELPEFIISTGDLVNDGNKLEQFEYYVAAIQVSSVPFFNVIGNHDMNRGSDNDQVTFYGGDVSNYRSYFGPDYYSFDHGGIHFVVLNSIVPSQRQNVWFENDLTLLGKDKPVVVFQHYPPTNTELKKLDSMNVHSIFTGHWHSEKMVKSAKTTSVNSPTFTMGGIDFSPAGFKVVDIEADGSMKTQWRYGGVNQKATIVSPAEGLSVFHRCSPIIVNLYDTSVDAEKVHWLLYQNDQLKARGKLSQDSPLSWSGKLPDVSELGPSWLRVDIEAQGKKNWEVRSKFNLDVYRPAEPKPSRSWPMFMGDPGHTGSIDSDIEIPLKLAWSTSTGGELDFSSPILAEGKLFVAVKSRRTDGPKGIVAIEPTSGKIIWKFKTEQVVNHSSCYEDGVICFAEVGGRVHGLDAKSGKELWAHELGDSVGRWIYGAPAAEEGRFYVGSMHRFARIAAKTGLVEWEKRIGQDKPTDWICSYSSPAVSGKFLVAGGFWTVGDNLVVLDKENGEKLWGHAADEGIQASPTIASDKVLFVTKKSILYCCNLADGKVLWTTELGESCAATTPAVQKDLVIAGSGDGIMKALRLSDGSEIWSHSSGKSIFKVSAYRRDDKAIMSSPLITKRKVFFGSSDGHLYCLDLGNGKEFWSYDFGVPVLSSPLVTGNSLFVATYDGRVYAFVSK